MKVKYGLSVMVGLFNKKTQTNFHQHKKNRIKIMGQNLNDLKLIISRSIILIPISLLEILLYFTYRKKNQIHHYCIFR